MKITEIDTKTRSLKNHQTKSSKTSRFESKPKGAHFGLQVSDNHFVITFNFGCMRRTSVVRIWQKKYESACDGDGSPDCDGRRRAPTTRARQPVRAVSRAFSRVLYARSTSRPWRIPARYRETFADNSRAFLRRAPFSPRVSSACRAPRRARRWRNPRTNRNSRPD